MNSLKVANKAVLFLVCGSFIILASSVATWCFNLYYMNKELQVLSNEKDRVEVVLSELGAERAGSVVGDCLIYLVERRGATSDVSFIPSSNVDVCLHRLDRAL